MNSVLAAFLTGIIVIIPAPPDPGAPAPPAGSASSSGPALSLPGPLPSVGLPSTRLPSAELPRLPSVRLPAPGRVLPTRVGNLNMTNWKLQLPVGGEEKPTEVLNPKPGEGVAGKWFNLIGDSSGGRGLVFRAPVNGVTTKGSKNPRSELREMNSDGSKAAWSSSSGTHTMIVREAFTRVPRGNPRIVGAQIHDAADDVTVFRLEGSNLYVTNGDDPHHKLVTSTYKLGTPFEAKFVVSDDQTRAFYNGHEVASIRKAYNGAYFKAGAYTQANCSNTSDCSTDNYGEAVIYDLRVEHAGGGG